MFYSIPKRLPDFYIGGVKKCGTGTLRDIIKVMVHYDGLSS